MYPPYLFILISYLARLCGLAANGKKRSLKLEGALLHLVELFAHQIDVVGRDDVGAAGGLADLAVLRIGDAGEEVDQTAAGGLVGIFQIHEHRAAVEQVIGDLDILYMTRVQRERFFNEEDYLRLRDSYILTPEKLKKGRPDLCVMHPLPRVNEISVAVDDDPRACYFKQVLNGKYMRMALILMLLNLKGGAQA